MVDVFKKDEKPGIEIIDEQIVASILSKVGTTDSKDTNIDEEKIKDIVKQAQAKRREDLAVANQQNTNF